MARGAHSLLGRRIAGLLALVIICLSAQAAGAAVSYPSPSPQGSVGISRPAISQRFFLGQGEWVKQDSKMWLDGIPVMPIVDPSGLILYVPPAPLSAGTHTVHLVAEIGAPPGYFYDPIIRDFTFTVAAGAPAAPPQPGPEERRALQRVNGYRTAAGLAPMKYSPALGASARSHARFLVLNPAQRDTDPHSETKGAPGFTGLDPSERATYWAYSGNTDEVINWTDRAEEAVDGWMDTLYHRIPLVHPGNREFGYGVDGTGDTLVNVAESGPGGENPGLSLWPYDGQAGVPTGWNGLETPDPFRLYSGVTGPVGYTITMTFGGPTPRGLTLTTWSLSGPDGAVTALPFDPKRDDRLYDTVALIPRVPLAPGARYTVSMGGMVDTGSGPQPYSKTWSFTTAGEHVPDPRRMTTTSLGGVLKQVTVDGTGFSSGMVVYLGGLPVRNLQVQSATRFSFEPPAGLTNAGAKDLLVVARDGQEARWPDFLAEGAATFRDDPSAFTAVPLTVHGVTLSRPALMYQDGQVLIPETALTELGATETFLQGIHRSYWAWAGRTGDYTLGHRASAVSDIPFSMTLPAQRINGQIYVEREFMSRLMLESLSITDGRLDIGMRDIGGHWARPAIIQLLSTGVVSGVGAGEFRPDDPLTRAAFVKMLVNARHVAPRPGDAGSFADTAEHWVAGQGYIGAAVKAGIVMPAEYPGGAFEPDRPITREEMAVMVTRALGLDAQALTRQLAVTDGMAAVAGRNFRDAYTWTKPGYIATAVEQGIITGYPEDGSTFSFQPLRQATRAEAVTMIVRTLNK